MHRIDADGHAANLFKEAPPPATKVDKDWLNAIQEEIANFIATDAGIALVKGTNTQLGAALVKLFLKVGASPSYGADLTNALLLEARTGDRGANSGKQRVFFRKVTTGNVATSEIWFTINAMWSASGTQWVKDTDACPAFGVELLTFGDSVTPAYGAAGGFLRQDGAGPFADAAWLARGPDPTKPVIGRETAVAPTLINSWADSGGGRKAAKYWCDPCGVVRLEGTIGGGALGSVAFVLPASHRPSALVYFAISSNGAAGGVSIDASGNVAIVWGATTLVSLDGINFGT